MPELEQDRPGPKVYSIPAHRGFADALVAGLVPRYREPGFGLARLTLLVPSTRARRTIGEAFIRQFGTQGQPGLLMPRMAVVGDLDLDEALGPLFDPLGADDIPRAIDPMRRWLALARILTEELGDKAPKGATLLRLARETARTMDRLLAEEIAPDDLLSQRVLDLVGDLAEHWQSSLVTFARVQLRWRAQLEDWNAVDAATRRNLLFRRAAARWKATPPTLPIVATGVTGAAPALAALLRVVSELPQGAVILPDLDLAMNAEVWDELGRAGAAPEPGAEPFARGDAVSHPQYHLKLLLNRMGVARGEVQPWHRRGEAAAPPERSHAISALFLPPQASRSWIDLPADKRRLAGVRIQQCATPEEEAQSVALLVREALEVPEKRIAVVTPDRALARRIVDHLGRWDIQADDTAGRPLSQTAAGRLLLLAAEVAAGGAAPVALTALLMHPLVRAGEERGAWLAQVRAFELLLRGPRPRDGLQPLVKLVAEAKHAGLAAWWPEVEAVLAPLLALDGEAPLADALAALAEACEALAGEGVWAREDGRALARFVEELGQTAREAGTAIDPAQLDLILRDAMEDIAVRPPWGGHPRVAIYGLLESRMSRADLVICAGLNEGVWPARGSVDALLAPPVLRALGVPGADFRIGLSAHDLAGALGAPEVVLSRSARDDGGPAIPSRFLLRVQALLGELLPRHSETATVALARALTQAEPAPPYPRPAPDPSPDQRDVAISATALDRLLGDPFQFYARSILRLPELEAIEAEPGPAWQGTTAHTILQRWHEARESDPAVPIAPIMAKVMEEENAHPLLRALWEPRLLAALEWVTQQVRLSDREVLAVEERAKGEFRFQGVRIHGKPDRIDRLPGGGIGIVDYKSGKPPTAAQVEAGFALQLGVLGLIARAGGFAEAPGAPEAFEYWSLGKSDKSETGFGYIETPLKTGNKRSGLLPEQLLPHTEAKLHEAVEGYIRGDRPFRARENPDYPAFTGYDQLMRLAEWSPRIDEQDAQ